MVSKPALRTPAPAKLNLTLEVLGRRDDGFHDLISVVQTVDLCDTITIAPAPARSLRFHGPNGVRPPLMPPAQGELVTRTWQLLIDRYGPGKIDDRAAVHVVKRIPIAAGLGGGSSNAAAFLRLARVFWSLPLSEAECIDLLAQVGSDAPLFHAAGAVLIEGRGERLTPLPDQTAPDQQPHAWSAALWTPELPLPARKTATMFGALRPPHFGGGERSRALAARLQHGLPPRAEDLVNTFDRVADEVLVGLRQARRRVAALAGLPPQLAGAGPSLFLLNPPALPPNAEPPNFEETLHATIVRPLPRAACLRVDEVADQAEAGDEVAPARARSDG